jgi:hypothetical protein
VRRAVAVGVGLALGLVVLASHVEAADLRVALVLLAAVAIPASCLLAAVSAVGEWMR